jgi:tRNA (guanine10-N2)-methyltransferase
MIYIVRFVKHHEQFRLPELKAAAESVAVEFAVEFVDLDSPFILASFSTDEDAKRVAMRAILVRDISELWAHADHFEGIAAILRARKIDTGIRSWKFIVDAFGVKLSLKEQTARIEQLSFLDFKGEIDLHNPDDVYVYLETYETNLPNNRTENPLPKHIYVGRFISNGARHLIAKYDLKKRAYLGTTSMDAELSLISANMARARKGMLIIDPFVGTGSFLGYND